MSASTAASVTRDEKPHLHFLRVRLFGNKCKAYATQENDGTELTVDTRPVHLLPTPPLDSPDQKGSPAGSRLLRLTS